MIRRKRTAKVYKEPTTDDEPSDSGRSDEEPEEWRPDTEAKKKGRGRGKKGEAAESKAATKPKESKPKTARKPRTQGALKGRKTADEEKETDENSALFQQGQSLQVQRVKEERLSVSVDRAFGDGQATSGAALGEEPSSSQQLFKVEKEEPEDDFTFEEPVQKKQKTSNAPQGRPVKLKSDNILREELQMNWDPVQVLAEKTGVQQWVCANIAQLLREENTIPFIVRYRKELIDHMDADAVRDVQLAHEELCTVAKKTQSIIQTLKKDGALTSELEQELKNCRSADELNHVYAPYKKGSKLSKARRAKELGLEPAAQTLLQSPGTLKLHSWLKPNTDGLSTIEEVTTGVEQILADMIAKDRETLAYVRSV